MQTLARSIVLTAVALLALCAAPARAAFNNTTPRDTFAGAHNYVITGNTLRTQSNNGNACAVGASSSATVSGIPAGSTVLKAYLYWGGSGNVDANVTLNGNALVADDTFTDNFQTFLNNQDYDLDYFGGVKDVTGIVTGNGSYTFSGLTVATTDNYGGNPDADYCGPAAVVAGWALVVVYTNASERYRYTRIYDGIKYFRGSSVTTTQSGFRVPDLIDGKVSIVTWEGDPDAASSVELDGFNEALTFDGNALLNVGCDENQNLYNSTVGYLGQSCNGNAWGVDIDTYDVTPFLYEGQTGATLEYSSGNDLVLLTAQVISTTNTPVADLGIAKTHVGSHFTAGQNGSYEIVVHNYGPEIATGTATVTDTLPAGLTFLSGTGTGWTCSAVGQVVTCNNSQTSLPVGADLPTLTLTVAVDGSAATSTENTASVSHPMFDGTGGNQTDTDTVTVRGSNLATSTKTVEDLDGGEVLEGDALRYTITLANTSAWGIDATGVSVVDDLPAQLGDLQVVSIPAGAVDQSVGTGGANGSGQVKVTGITVPAGGSVQIVFEVTVGGGALPGDIIDNTAIVTNPSGPANNPSVQVQVAASQAPEDGQKRLYLYTSPISLTRVPQSTNSTSGITIENENDFEIWPLTAPVATGKSLVLPAQDVTVQLVTRASGSRTGTSRPVLVQLLNDGTVIGADTVGVSGGTNTLRTWSITIPQTTVAAGTSLQLRVENQHQSNNRDIVVVSRTSAANYSRITFDTDTVVNVDDVSVYTSIYPGTSQKDPLEPGDTIYIRADVSDPFGGYDVSGARLTLDDGNGNTVVNDLAMTARTNPANNGTPNRIFEYAYTIPASPNFGTWTASVTATEGSETPAVTHKRSKTFTVAPKALVVVKSHAGDFIAGAQNSYTLTVSNTGGTTVNGTTTVEDTLATGLAFVSGTGSGWSCGAAGQVVTCTSNASIPPGGSMPPITLTVFVSGNMGNSVDNQAKVGNSTIAGGFQKAGNTDTAIIRHPDLSTSTKAVTDLDGGDADPGDTLRYTITLVESAGYAANDVTVTDALPASLTGLSGVNGTLTTCNGTPSVAGNTLTVSGISLAGGASCAIVFDVAISGSAGAGLAIDNSATVDNPNGPGATPAAQTVTVSQSQVVIPGGKALYVYANNTMTRTPQAGNASNTINENSYQEFVLSSLQAPLQIAPGSTISVDLWLARSGNTTTTARSVYVRLFKNGTAPIGAPSESKGFNSTTAARQNFTITAPSFGSAIDLQPGDTLVLRVYNDSGSGGTPRTVSFSQRVTGGSPDDDLSVVTVSTPTVVNVGSVAAYSAPYPSTSQAGAYGAGETVYIRATVTDPFGFADISGGAITIKDPDGASVHAAALTNGAHSKSTSGATRIYEYAYTIPADPPTGAWTASVTANEGTEGTITHTGNGGFNVGGRVTLRKTWGAGATAGHSVALTIGGGTSAVAGSSTAPSTLVEATANAAAGATITLSESFTNGDPGEYTVSLACTKDGDGTTVTPVGTGLSRTITMPAGSVTCTWTNSKSVPLTLVKIATVISDPVSGTSNPKAIPGAIVEYTIIVTNPATVATDTDTVIVTDALPQQVELSVADLLGAGSGPVSFTDGSPSSGMSYSFVSLGDGGDDIAFSNDGGATWTYVPVPGLDGEDPLVTHLRVNPKGAFNANNAQFTLKFRVRVK